jgi:signal transduction histidine kinase
MDTPARPLSIDQLYGLAPRTLPFHRSLRYTGDGMSVRLADFSPSDQALIERLYAIIGEILVVLREHRDHPDIAVPQLKEFCREAGWHQFATEIRQLGEEISAADENQRLRQVVHDLRGGGFLALSVYLQLIELELFQPLDLQRMFFLARDQLKIMRNGVDGIDPLGEDRDRGLSLHDVDLLVEKWADSAHRLQGRVAKISVESQFVGAIAERCLEFSALDRVIYNLMNNAALNSADERVYMAIVPLEISDPENLRFVIVNKVSPIQRATLEQRWADGPGQLFQGGFTTGGNGLGMRICADFICNAYGLTSVDQGLSEGHFGAITIADNFAVWFHWPIAAE